MSRFDARLRAYGSSARTHLLTIIRVVMLERSDAVWTSTLIRAMAACGIQERNARQTINRVSERGIIASEKVGARAKWRVTDEGRKLIEKGQMRAARFNGIQENWDGQWLVVICSVPETEREKRRRFRGRMELNGFGSYSPSVFVSTHLEKEPVVNEVLSDLGLMDGALVLKGRPGETVGNETLLNRAWDIESLRENHRFFIDMLKDTDATTDEEKFAAFVETERAWFYVAFTDPELPIDLLPGNWPCKKAKQMYGMKYAEWRPAALRWFDRIDRTA